MSASCSSVWGFIVNATGTLSQCQKDAIVAQAKIDNRKAAGNPDDPAVQAQLDKQVENDVNAVLNLNKANPGGCGGFHLGNFCTIGGTCPGAVGTPDEDCLAKLNRWLATGEEVLKIAFIVAVAGAVIYGGLLIAPFAVRAVKGVSGAVKRASR